MKNASTVRHCSKKNQCLAPWANHVCTAASHYSPKTHYTGYIARLTLFSPPYNNYYSCWYWCMDIIILMGAKVIKSFVLIVQSGGAAKPWIDYICTFITNYNILACQCSKLMWSVVLPWPHMQQALVSTVMSTLYWSIKIIISRCTLSHTIIIGKKNSNITYNN